MRISALLSFSVSLFAAPAIAHYNPLLGRFQQRDPNATAAPILTALVINGAPLHAEPDRLDVKTQYADGINLYQYVRANPINKRDPLGLSDFDWLLEVDNFTTNYALGLVGVSAQLSKAKYGLAKGARLSALYTAAAFLWDEFIWDQGEGALLGLALGGFGATACFPAGTGIAMADGTIARIENILPGDFVACDIDPTEEVGSDVCLVEATFARSFEALIDVTIRTDHGEFSVSATPEHPFYSEQQRDYVPARELVPGTCLRSSDGSSAEVTGVTARQVNELVYNFSVRDAHNYFVTNGGSQASVLVHNPCFGQSLKHFFGSHGKDWGATTIRQFRKNVMSHIQGATHIINGTYRGTIRGTHYYSSKTGMWAFVDEFNEIITGWYLKGSQKDSLFRVGNVQ